jgi:hypothetical protein
MSISAPQFLEQFSNVSFKKIYNFLTERNYFMRHPQSRLCDTRKAGFVTPAKQAL